MKGLLLVIWRTFVNLSLNNFLLFNYFLTLKILTLVLIINHFAFAMAVITWTSRLSVNAWSKLLHVSNLAPTLAGRALLYSALFTTFSATRLAKTLTIYSNFNIFTEHDFFKHYFEWMLHGLHLLRATLLSSTATHSEETSKDVVHPVCNVFSAVFKTYLTILVKNITFFLISQDFVGILEFLVLFFVSATVRMVFYCKFYKSLFYFIKTGLLSTPRSSNFF
jgi:hypothetical protein